MICEQVLEHVPDPWAAARNLRELCLPGGRVIVSTPFLVKVHELPAYGMLDYWRFTPRGLTTLLEGAGLEVESRGSWGNRQCVVGNLGRWSAYRRWHSLHNEPGAAAAGVGVRPSPKRRLIAYGCRHDLSLAQGEERRHRGRGSAVRGMPLRWST